MSQLIFLKTYCLSMEYLDWNWSKNYVTYGSIGQLVQGRLINLLNFIASPIGARGSSRRSVSEGGRDSARKGSGSGRRLNSAIGPCKGPGKGP